MQSTLRFVAVSILLATASAIRAGDWPTWRYDANRSAASPHALPAKLYRHWSREYPPQTPAWPDQGKMQYDIAPEPIVKGRTLFVNSARHDALRAIDTRTGQVKWTFFADGPVRFGAAAWEDRVYFAADDGYLYCLRADTGKLVWKFRGGPSDRKILGNERLISTWPARGAPVIADGTVYFAASIWPFMGIFIHAVDARTGQAIWTNDGDGSVYMKQPHNTDSFAGVAPQGPLVALGDKLLVPGGRSIPACFDRQTGKMVRYQLAENGKRGGGSEVAAIGNVFFNGGAAFDATSQKHLADTAKIVVLTKDEVFAYDKGLCKVFDLANAKMQEAEVKPAKDEKDAKDAKDTKDGKKKKKVARWVMPELASTKMVAVETMIKAGPRLYLGGPGHVTVLEWNVQKPALSPSWDLAVPGQVVRLIAADDRLFAITREGRIECFGGEEAKPVAHARLKESLPKLEANAEANAKQMISDAKDRRGYAVAWGVGDGQLVEALVRHSEMHVVVVEPSAAKVQAFRERWTRADLYGTRIAIVPGDAKSVQLPPYLVSVMVCEQPDPADASLLAAAYQSLRPFGGTLSMPRSPAADKLVAAFMEKKQTNAKVRASGEMIQIVRDGPLPGSANWTHEHADAANTRVSKDQLVKAPLGVLWFGGPSHDDILPRHGHGPQPQVIDGRMIIEGVDLIRAIDIYTGRLLWETKLPGVGAFYNNLFHQPGANSAGSNYVSMPDGIYVAYQNVCVKLDPATGKKLAEFALPKLADAKQPPRWGYLNVAGDFLIGGADPLLDPKFLPPQPKPGETGNDPEPGEKKKDSSITKLFKKLKSFSDNLSASRRLVVLDRHTGQVLWSASAKCGFRHNAICVGGGRLYAIDRLSGEQIAKLKKQGVEPPQPRLVCFDLKTGKELWSPTFPPAADDEEQAGVFGTWLSYSEKHDVLIEAGRVARDTLFDEPKGMRAYSAKDGKVLWFEADHVGPAMIHHDTILQGQGACDLLTGKIKMRIDPITLEESPWRWARNYGCNTPSASEHLMTFRSGAAGYFDLCNDGGTGNFGGFRSSCTNNLIVAGGIITAPEYTRTCVCAYQNQSSIALVHMPDAEMWTFFGVKEVKGTIKRLGLALGGAGDRKAEDGTLWLEYPSTGGASPAVQIATTPAKPELFRRHPSAVTGPYNWVACSGIKNVQEIAVTLGAAKEPRMYTVKLYFAEPDKLAAGKRRFDIAIEGKRVLADFDIAKEAGGPGRSIVKEFKGITAQGRLRVALTPSAGSEVQATVLCGVELIAEEKK